MGLQAEAWREEDGGHFEIEAVSVVEGRVCFRSAKTMFTDRALIGRCTSRAELAFIHAIGLLARDYAFMASRGTGLIWSPRSNVTLYGDTAVVTEAARFGVQIALGTDWMPTGSILPIANGRASANDKTGSKLAAAAAASG